MLEIRPTILFELECRKDRGYFLWVREENAVGWMVASWYQRPSEDEVKKVVTLIKRGIDICTKVLMNVEITPQYINMERPLVFPD